MEPAASRPLAPPPAEAAAAPRETVPPRETAPAARREDGPRDRPARRAEEPPAQTLADVSGDEPGAESFDESFENAAPAPLPLRDAPTGSDARPAEPARPAPSLETLVEKIPTETRRALEELLRARFTGVRRVRPGQLR